MVWLGGGCLCGAVRYEAEDTGAIVDFCHCRSCRRSTGGATVVWMQVPPEAFRLLAGTPAQFASSARGSRLFCPACGSQIAMTDPDGRSVGITVGTLDDAGAVQPAAHGWDSARPRWLCLTDDLPRFSADPPYDET